MGFTWKESGSTEDLTDGSTPDLILSFLLFVLLAVLIILFAYHSILYIRALVRERQRIEMLKQKLMALRHEKGDAAEANRLAILTDSEVEMEVMQSNNPLFLAARGLNVVADASNSLPASQPTKPSDSASSSPRAWTPQVNEPISVSAPTSNSASPSHLTHSEALISTVTPSPEMIARTINNNASTNTNTSNSTRGPLNSARDSFFFSSLASNSCSAKIETA